MFKIIEFIGRWPRAVFLAFNLILLLLVALLNYLSGAELTFSFFYLFPVMLATLFAGRFAGVVFALACCVIWLVLDINALPYYSSHLIFYWNTAARMGVFLVMIHVLNILKRESLFARRDFLTGIPNRRFFIDAGTRELARLRRYRRPFTIAYIDIDDFKKINDVHSHNAGDAALRVIAGVIANTVRITDIAARIGGDEFAILLPEADLEPSLLIVNRVREEVSDVARANDWLITVSIGMATYYSLPKTVIEAVKKADELMYEAKNSGKNQIRYVVVSDGPGSYEMPKEGIQGSENCKKIGVLKC